MNQPTSSSPIRDQAGGCTSSISRPSQCGCLDAGMFEACVASTASLPCAETPWQEEQPSGSAQPTYPKPYNVYVYIHIYIYIQTYIYICCARRASVSTPSLRRREIYTLSNTRTHTHIYICINTPMRGTKAPGTEETGKGRRFGHRCLAHAATNIPGACRGADRGRGSFKP